MVSAEAGKRFLFDKGFYCTEGASYCIVVWGPLDTLGLVAQS